VLSGEDLSGQSGALELLLELWRATVLLLKEHSSTTWPWLASAKPRRHPLVMARVESCRNRITYRRYGDPSVLTVEEVPEPTPDTGRFGLGLPRLR
jgi:hypothetical protein